MKKCINCAHYETDIDESNKTWSECTKIKWTDQTADKVPEEGFLIYASALDDSSLKAKLLTGPSFSCSCFKQKPN
jgi:hypothetical protein